MEEAGLIECRWESGDDMVTVIFIKKYANPTLDKHAEKFVGYDEYMSHNYDTHKGRVSEVG
eukprot:8615726-Ditylum_brightwellii.AAC.1